MFGVGVHVIHPTLVSEQRSHFQFVFLCFIATVAATELAHIVTLQVGTYHPLPWTDEWDTLALFDYIEKSPGTGLGFFLAPHNEHRIPIPRLITLLDLVAARG